MSSRKRGIKRKSSATLSIGLLTLFIGFILGVYLSPQIIETIPQQLLDRLGIVKPQPATLKKTVINKPTKEQIKFKERIYSLEIAVFSDVESALGLLDTLSTRGYSVTMETSNSGERILYKVGLGFWTSEEEAMEFASAFETKEEMKAKVVQIK